MAHPPSLPPFPLPWLQLCVSEPFPNCCCRHSSLQCDCQAAWRVHQNMLPTATATSGACTGLPWGQAQRRHSVQGNHSAGPAATRRPRVQGRAQARSAPPPRFRRWSGATGRSALETSRWRAETMVGSGSWAVRHSRAPAAALRCLCPLQSYRKAGLASPHWLRQLSDLVPLHSGSLCQSAVVRAATALHKGRWMMHPQVALSPIIIHHKQVVRSWPRSQLRSTHPRGR